MLGPVALFLDHGKVPGGDDQLWRTARSIARRYGLRTSDDLDRAMARGRVLYWSTLTAGQRAQLLQCIQRHRNAGFPALAVAYPSLCRFVASQRKTALRGGGGASMSTEDFDRAFDRVFGDPRPVHRRRPATYPHVAQYPEALDDDVLSDMTVA